MNTLYQEIQQLIGCADLDDLQVHGVISKLYHQMINNPRYFLEECNEKAQNPNDKTAVQW